ncbi:hypothetical protein FA95DRAFT_1496433 [Auriscalpium vulgare]|uniref:Uncharacterized protein n=2 Tax=Auriscalpium vulgare TaxID=40419 RepID=A0ACB8RBK7_9AGAM|nr:hypothetical protein FA95DRAFT_1501771 [Auriscalpium vulgare]KAI0044871.1 hypothetical protein FA95DRAFT_1496433 [Auriscalpium vulgare]
MVPTHDLTREDISRAARFATRILRQRGLTCCLFGSAGCDYWADIGRVPGDVDIIVIPEDNENAEDIKDLIVEEDSRFYLIASRRPLATHRVLWCQLPDYQSTQRALKVDILIPSTDNINIPSLDKRTITRLRHIPVMDLFGLLLLKVQGWQDRRMSDRLDFIAKLETDVSDIEALLVEAKSRGIRLRRERRRAWDEDFIERGETHVEEFVKIHGFRKEFRRLGFST